MRLTQFADLALRTLIFLALRDGQLSSIPQIARAHRISENHLSKVVLKLGREGFIETTRGRAGGIRLARAPAEIGLGDVVRRLEEDMAIVACFPGGGTCVLTGRCGGRTIIDEALGAFLGVLDRYSLEDLIVREGAKTARRLGLTRRSPRLPLAT
ncbi:MAG: RrF2 family transcriptional regulator [Rhizomicrobium sp.]